MENKTFTNGNCQIVNENGKIATLRALIDPGSHYNYIFHRHTKILNLKMIKSQQNISVLGDNSRGTSIHRAIFLLQSKINEFSIKLLAVTEKLSSCN